MIIFAPKGFTLQWRETEKKWSVYDKACEEKEAGKETRSTVGRLEFQQGPQVGWHLNEHVDRWPGAPQAAGAAP